MTRLLWQHPGVAGRPYPGSGENDDDHQTRDDPLERIPLAGSSRPLPQVVAGLARPPRLLLLLCAFLFGVAGTSPATTPVRDSRQSKRLSGARLDRVPVDKLPPTVHRSSPPPRRHRRLLCRLLGEGHIWCPGNRRRAFRFGAATQRTPLPPTEI